MSFPSNPQNGQTTTVNSITYVYNSTNNAWKRQTLTDIAVSGAITSGNISTGNVTSTNGINFGDNSRITSGLVYDLDTISADGTKNTFLLRYNQSTVAVTNPWNLLVSINGLVQSAFTENTDTVWLSHALCAYSGYTIASGNIKFSDTLPAGTTVQMRTQPGSPNSTPRTYPFNPVDIVLGM